MNAIYVGSTPIVEQGGGNSFDINNYLTNPVKYESIDAINDAKIDLSNKCIFADIIYKPYNSNDDAYMRYTGYIPGINTYGTSDSPERVPASLPIAIFGVLANYHFCVISYGDYAQSLKLKRDRYSVNLWVGDAPKLLGS